MFLHRTIRQTNNLLGIQPGRWIAVSPGSAPSQFLFNCFTNVCVFNLQEIGDSNARLQKVYNQPLMSKFRSLCKGPPRPATDGEDELDTFFALRDNDVIQYVYSKTENLFVKVSQILLPPILVSSEFIYWSDKKDGSNPVLVISAFHGGLGIFEFEDGKTPKLVYEGKTSVVLNCYIKNDFLVRLEGGGKIMKYNIRKPAEKTLLNGGNESNDISVVFDLQEHFAFCKKNKIVIDDNEYSLTSDETILDSLVMKDNFVLLLTDQGNLYKFCLPNDIKLIINFENAIKIFPLNDNFILVKSRSCFNIYNVTENTTYKTLVNTGIMDLKFGSNVNYVSPCFISYSNNNLMVTKQGLSVATISSYTIAEQIVGLYNFEFENHYYIAVSLQSSTRLLELVGNKIQVSDSIKLKENSSTIGIGVLKTNSNSQRIIQIVPDGIVIAVKDKKKEHLYQGQCPHLCTYNSRQMVVYNTNRCIRVYQCSKEIENYGFELQYNITTLKLSNPDPTTGYSEFIAFGCSEIQQKGNFFLLLQKMSNDQTARTNILKQNMPCSISSIEFINETTICVGLSNGAIVVGKIDKKNYRITKIVVHHLGVGAMILKKIIYKNTDTLFAMNSRPLLIQMRNGVPEFHPISMNSVSFVSPLPFEKHILAVSGQTLSINIISDVGNDFSFTNFPMKSRIVSVCSIPKERFTIVGLSNSFYIFDPIKGSNLPSDYFELVESFENEKIVCIDVSRYSNAEKINSTNVCYIVVVTHAENNTSKIRIYPFSMATFSSQVQLPIVATYNRYISTVSTVIIHNNIHIIGSCKNNLLDFKISNKMLGLVTQISDVGIDIQEIVFSGRFENSAFFFVGDKSRSVKLVELNNNLKQFNIISEEGFPRNIISLSLYQKSMVAGGDILGDIFILKDNNVNFQETVKFDQRVFKAKKRLTSKLNYHIGDIVTGIWCSTFSSQITKFDYVWYSTVSNGLGCFIYKNIENNQELWNKDFSTTLRILQLLELEMSNLWFSLTAYDSITFRNLHYPSTNIIDLDIISLFSKINENHRKMISKKISEYCKFEIAPFDLDFYIQKFNNYYSFWQIKADK